MANRENLVKRRGQAAKAGFQAPQRFFFQGMGNG
jgi:hypothetical protein